MAITGLAKVVTLIIIAATNKFNFKINAPAGAVIIATTAMDGFGINKANPIQFSVYDDGSCDASLALAEVTIADEKGGVSDIVLKNAAGPVKDVTDLKVSAATNMGDLQYSSMTKISSNNYILNYCKKFKTKIG